MGLSCSCLKPPIPEEVQKILNTLEEKVPDIVKKTSKKKDKLDEKKMLYYKKELKKLEKQKINQKMN